MKRIAAYCQKGGVGKSSLLLLVGYILQRANNRVKYTDLDPQGTLTHAIFYLEWESETEEEADFELIDFASKLTGDNASYVKTCDRILVPATMGVMDRIVLESTLKSLKESGVNKRRIAIVPNMLRNLPSHQESLEAIKALGYKTTNEIPLRSEISKFVETGKLTPATREIISNIILSVL